MISEELAFGCSGVQTAMEANGLAVCDKQCLYLSFEFIPSIRSYTAVCVDLNLFLKRVLKSCTNL